MPSKAAHLAQAQHNRAFFASIDLDSYSDWALVALFYAAVHYIDALLAERGIHPHQHVARDNAVLNAPELKVVWEEYRKLKTDSFNARYYPPFRKPRTYVEVANTLYLARIVATMGL